MSFNLFAVKPKNNQAKTNIFNTNKSETVKQPEQAETKVEESIEDKTVEEIKQENIVEKDTSVATETDAAKEDNTSKQESLEVEIITEKKRKTRKTKKTEGDQNVEEEKEVAPANVSSETPEEFNNAKFSPSAVKLDKVKTTFSVEYQDDEWNTLKEELEKRADNIRIEPDINLGSVRILLAQCTNLYSDLKREQRANKTFYNVLCDKTIGLIQRQQQINAVGKNSEDRKKNSILSCEQFKMKADKAEYNLYDISMILQDRIDTINDLLDDVKQKKETLISYLAVLKLENGMVK